MKMSGWKDSLRLDFPTQTATKQTVVQFQIPIHFKKMWNNLALWSGWQSLDS